MFRQGDRFRGGRDLLRLGQPRLEGCVHLYGRSRIALCQGHTHEPPVSLFCQRIKRYLTCECGSSRLPLSCSTLPGGEPIKQQQQTYLPLLLLLLAPCVKGGVLSQPEAIQEGAAHQGKGMLNLCDQGGVLLQRCGRGELPDLLVCLLHHIQIQLEGACRFRPSRSR